MKTLRRLRCVRKKASGKIKRAAEWERIISELISEREGGQEVKDVK